MRLGSHPALLLIMLLFSAVAFSLLSNGLPLHLVGDEESLIGGALRMLETGTFIPALHPSAFTTLYYSALLPWLYMLFWAPYAGWVYFFVPGVQNLNDLAVYFAVHTEKLWFIARIPSMVAGAAIILFVYKIAQRLFNDSRIASISAIFMATSLLHLQLSLVARHWIFSTLLFTIALYLLSINVYRDTRTAVLSGATVGLTFGISVIGFMAAFFIALAYIILAAPGRSVKALLQKPIWYFAGSAGVVALFFMAIHPQAFLTIVSGKETPALASKGLTYALSESRDSIYYLLSTEYMLVIMAVIGLALLVVNGYRRLALVIVSVIVLYNVSLFYFLHNAARYHFFIVPLLCIAAGYGIETILKWTRTRARIAGMITVLVFAVPLLVVARFALLESRATTEQLAYRWVLTHARDTGFLLHSTSLTFPQESVYLAEEDRRGRSLRINKALAAIEEGRFGLHKMQYTNMHYWNTAERSAGSLEQYLEQYRPSYFIVSYDHAADLDRPEIQYLLLRASLVQSFGNGGGAATEYALEPFGDLGIAQHRLFAIERFGQHIGIYALQYPT